MTLKKRGLGRGLEALLAAVPVKDECIPAGPKVDTSRRAMEEVNADGMRSFSLDFQADSKQSPLFPINSPALDDQAEKALTLIKNIHSERMYLLEEAEILRKLISDFESIVRNDLL